ncbi:hypothetical protein GAY28_20380, partial [Azospirillum brasilense]|nr:hypothetical protein [Azospirillum brasilense]
MHGVLTQDTQTLAQTLPLLAIGGQPAGVLGFLAGWLSILAMQAVTVAERGFRALPIPVWARPALGGLALGALALVVPQVLGAGPGADPSQLARGLEAMAVLLAAKIVASALSLGSGFRGGLVRAPVVPGGRFGGVAHGVGGLRGRGLGARRVEVGEGGG